MLSDPLWEFLQTTLDYNTFLEQISAPSPITISSEFPVTPEVGSIKKKKKPSENEEEEKKKKKKKENTLF